MPRWGMKTSLTNALTEGMMSDPGAGYKSKPVFMKR